MLGFLLGTVCLIGLIKVARAHRYGYGYGGHGGGRCGGYGSGYGGYGGDAGPGSWRGGWQGGGFRSRGFGPRWFLRAIFERLDTTPGQEKVILQAADELKAAFGGARETRSDFASVFRGPAVDESTLQDIFVKHDTVISETRRTAVEAVRKAHEA